MRSIITTQGIRCTPEGRRRAEGLLASTDNSMASLAKEMNVEYRWLWRFFRGESQITVEEYNQIDRALSKLTGHGLETVECPRGICD